LCLIDLLLDDQANHRRDECAGEVQARAIAGILQRHRSRLLARTDGTLGLRLLGGDCRGQGRSQQHADQS
jgi:hypothetical protein